jgi:hypothetical protein
MMTRRITHQFQNERLRCEIRMDKAPTDEQSTATDESGMNNQKKSLPCCGKHSQMDDEAASHDCQCSCSGGCGKRNEGVMESYMPQGLKEGLKGTLGSNHSVYVKNSIVTMSEGNGAVIQGSDIDRSKIDGSIVRGSKFGPDRGQK